MLRFPEDDDELPPLLDLEPDLRLLRLGDLLVVPRVPCLRTPRDD